MVIREQLQTDMERAIRYTCGEKSASHDTQDRNCIEVKYIS